MLVYYRELKKITANATLIVTSPTNYFVGILQRDKITPNATTNHQQNNTKTCILNPNLFLLFKVILKKIKKIYLF